jgi:cytochrome d ubiquinol oxidase subunit I
LLASIAAYHLLRKKSHVYYKKALKLTVMVSLVLAFLTVLTGDISAKFLAKYQPVKLAAMEWHFETTENAPLVVGGILDKKTNEIKHALYIPSLLSFLAHGNIQAEVIGLNDIPKDLWPPLYIHYLFDAMVGIGFYLLSICALFLFLWWRKKGGEWNPWVLRGIFLSGPLAFIAIELGWMCAEVGRQPWIIVGLMKVRQAGTAAANVGTIYLLFTALYFLLATIAIGVLVRLFRKNNVEKELEERGIIL